MDEKVKVTFHGKPGQSYSCGNLSFPSGQVVELDSYPDGLDDIKLTEAQRKVMGLKAGQDPFTIEVPPSLAAEQKKKKAKVEKEAQAVKEAKSESTKKKGKKKSAWSGEGS